METLSKRRPVKTSGNPQWPSPTHKALIKAPKKPLPPPRGIRPFILTCDKRLDELEKFVTNYEKIASSLLDPVLIIDDRNEKVRERYHELLLRLKPFATIAQPRYKENDFENLQYFMIKDFPKWALHYSDNDIVFMEDDIVLSSQFPSAIKKASQYLQIEPDFITFYARSKYSRLKRYPAYHFMTPFNGNEYYGNICVLFKRRVLEDLKANWKKLLSWPPGWDLRWGRYLQKNQYRMYETKKHYANHAIGKSAISGKHKAERDETHYQK